MKRILILILLLAVTAFGLRSSREQWMTLGPFDGGINIESPAGKMPDNQLYYAYNCLWQDGALIGREGFARYADPLSGYNLEFIDVFKRTDGQVYLIIGDGRQIWYQTNLTGTATRIDVGRIDTGTVDCLADSLTVKGNDTFWQSVFGTGDGFTIVIDDTATRTINYIQNDTVLYVTVAFTDALAAVDYYILRDNIAPVAGIVLANKYWIYSNAGVFFFASSDSTGDIEEATGTRYQFTQVTRSGGKLHLAVADALGIRTGDFAQIVTNPNSDTNSTRSAIWLDSAYAMTYPVDAVGAEVVILRAGGVAPDSADNEYISFTNLEYDASSAFTILTDSLTGHTTGEGAAYYKVFCDSAEFNETTFRTGDWFFWYKPLTTATDSAKAMHYLYCYPVVGGFIDTTSNAGGPDTAVIVCCSNNQTTGTGPAKEVAFFRMSSVKSRSQEEGVVFATEYQRRIFYAHDTTCNELEWSEPDMPDSHISTSSHILSSKGGDCCIAAAQQRGDLIIYMDNSIFRLYGDGTNAGYGSEEVCDYIGCVAAKTLINVNNTEHYWLYSDGYYYSDGGAPERISDAVQSYFTDTLNAAYAHKAVAGYDEEHENIWLSFPGGAAVENNKTLVCHLPNQSWWLQEFVAGYYYYNRDWHVSDSVRFMAGGVDSSITHWVNGTQDDGDSFTIVWTTALYDMNDITRRKRTPSISFEYLLPDNDSKTLTFYSYREISQRGNTSKSCTLSASPGVAYPPVRLYQHTQHLNIGDPPYAGHEGTIHDKALSWGFRIVDGSGFALHGLRLKYIILGEDE